MIVHPGELSLSGRYGVEAAGIEPVNKAIENPKQDALLPAIALILLGFVIPSRPIPFPHVPPLTPLAGHTGDTCGPTRSSRSRTQAARVPRSRRAHEKPVGG